MCDLDCFEAKIDPCFPQVKSEAWCAVNLQLDTGTNYAKEFCKLTSHIEVGKTSITNTLASGLSFIALQVRYNIRIAEHNAVPPIMYKDRGMNDP